MPSLISTMTMTEAELLQRMFSSLYGNFALHIGSFAQIPHIHTLHRDVHKLAQYCPVYSLVSLAALPA